MGHAVVVSCVAMPKRMFRPATAIGLAFLLCGAGLAQAEAPATAGPVVVATAGLKPVLDAIAAAWADGGRPPVTIAYAASGDMAKALTSGAQVDVVIAADLKEMDDLAKAKLIATATRQNVIGVNLVLVAAAADASPPLKVATSFDLAGALGEGRLAVCRVASCPAGLSAKQALEALHVWSNVEPKLMKADTAGAVLTLVARGDARLGVAYATDAKTEPKIKVVGTFPASTHDKVVYPIALAAASTNPGAASFEAFFRSGAAVRILVGRGFTILR